MGVEKFKTVHKFSLQERITKQIMKKGKTAIDKLTKHFDEDWNTQRSTLRQSLEEQARSRYNPTSSWDAKSDNPRIFSRLDHAVEVAVQQTRPITLSGTAVISLESPQGLGIFKPNSDVSRSNIPLTLEQRELGMIETDLSAKIPIKDGLDGTKAMVLEDGPTFRNMVLNSPQYKVKSAPDFYVEHTAKTDKRLLHPKERRELLDFEIKKQIAERNAKKAISDRQHTKSIMAGPNYHRGVLRVDSADNPNSEIYGKKASELLERGKQIQISQEKKREYLSQRGSSMLAIGNILVPESIDSSVKETKLFTKKGGEVHNMSYEETRDRLFKRNEQKFNPERGQRLRDQDLSGKSYNIITHSNIEQWPSTVAPRENRILAHPSQNSLDSHRNIQGALATRTYY